ncbi:MFS transporter [Streptomyces sp. NPDC002838]|uniref:MFS transporter n=1 Tax=Streptomyces sp. NPDC002838 TaxID=3154436 RepID=UPI0033206C06
MLGGRLADVAGRRRVPVVGFVVFGVAGLVGGLAQEPGQLIAARAVQGAGAAALAPVALALIAVNYAEGTARSHALGLWGASGAVGGTARRAVPAVTNGRSLSGSSPCEADYCTCI